MNINLHLLKTIRFIIVVIILIRNVSYIIVNHQTILVWIGFNLFKNGFLLGKKNDHNDEYNN